MVIENNQQPEPALSLLKHHIFQSQLLHPCYSSLQPESSPIFTSTKGWNHKVLAPMNKPALSRRQIPMPIWFICLLKVASTLHFMNPICGLLQQLKSQPTDGTWAWISALRAVHQYSSTCFPQKIMVIFFFRQRKFINQ